MSHTPAWDDLNQFADTSDFAVEAVHTPVSGQPRPVVGIFESQTIEPRAGEYRAQTDDPTFEGTMAALSGIQRGDTLTINGQIFDVMAPPQPDGTGWALVKLSPA